MEHEFQLRKVNAGWDCEHIKILTPVKKTHKLRETKGTQSSTRRQSHVADKQREDEHKDQRQPHSETSRHQQDRFHQRSRVSNEK